MTHTDYIEPKKIVLIIGNVFDLDLGLKTSYKDFWESEFCPRDYPAPIIDHLNKRNYIGVSLTLNCIINPQYL